MTETHHLVLHLDSHQAVPAAPQRGAAEGPCTARGHDRPIAGDPAARDGGAESLGVQMKGELGRMNLEVGIQIGGI